MKTRINLSIDKDLFKHVKTYAEKRQTSVSHLVEEYFIRMIKPVKRSTIITLVEGLEKPCIEESDFKKIFTKNNQQNMASK